MDRQAKTTIQINGRLYDARTGKILAQKASPQSARSKLPVQRGIVLDGICKTPAAPSSTKSVSKPTSIPKTNLQARNHGQTLDVRAIKRPKKSQTLVRTVVKKPKPAPTQAAAIATPILTSHLTNKSRFERAKQFTMSRKVSHFNSYTKPQPVLAKLQLAKAPDLDQQNAPIAQPATSTPAINSNVAKQHATKMNRKQKRQGKEEVFAHQIAAANTHLLTYDHKKPLRERIARRMRVSPKIVSVSAAVIAMAFLGGFFMYQRIPSVAMRVAASTAGFQGTLPSNIPNGYAFSGPIRAENKNLTITYRSRTDNRKILISQRPTDWTSESLLSNYIIDSKLRFQTYQDNGLTIYIYNGGSATWVDKGIWYNVTSQGALNSQQILSLAASM